MLQILYRDKDIVVCIKPAGVVSTDEPGGMPQLVREALGSPEQPVYTVHRLDQVVSGLMVLALRKKSAAVLGTQITERQFDKQYLAVLNGVPEEPSGRYDDLLFRDTAKNRTYVVDRMRKGVREASLEYEVLGKSKIDTGNISIVRIHLLTGRTHQIRAQFSSRHMPLVGDRKYGAPLTESGIALWSAMLAFNHPWSGKPMRFEANPPAVWPWSLFPDAPGPV